MLYSWFRGIKRNLLHWFRDIKIPSSRSIVKYEIGIYKISREVWNSSLSLHCYCFGWSIQKLQEVREVGFCSPWSNSAYPQWFLFDGQNLCFLWLCTDLMTYWYFVQIRDVTTDVIRSRHPGQVVVAIISAGMNEKHKDLKGKISTKASKKFGGMLKSLCFCVT